MDRRTCLHNLSALGLLPLITSMQQKKVIKRTIPSSKEQLTAVGVGTWRTFDVGDASSEREPLRGVLKTLIEKSGSVIDSSPMYGRSERVVGELSTELSLNSKLFVATKVWTTGEEEGIRQMNNSFSLLKRDKLDLMQIHNLVDWQTHLKTLRKWKEAGKIRYFGITHYTESAYSSVEQILKNNTLDFLQINYSLVSRKAEERLFPLAKEKQVAVIINQPFEGGGLFGNVKGKQLPAWASEFDCNSWAQFFLKFILSNPTVTCVIPGTDRVDHMVDNMAAGYGDLPSEKHRDQMIKIINS
ncbi:MAG TPA: aldo/keto reductase [Chryseolinea sp.]|nr:aldo/keto reductase [Chryseolinea sp.]